MHISGIDLNLAVVLRALLDKRSVSHAARQLGLSQSATSHALARLRDVLHDPLFVRTRTGLLPTPRAEQMADTLRAALDLIESSFFTPPVLDPRTLTRTFYLRPSDYVEYLIVPRLLARLGKIAPRVDVWSRALSVDPTQALADGQLDLLIQPASPNEQAASIHTQALWDDRFVGLMRRGHPLSKGRLTVEKFAAAGHVLVAPGGRPGSRVDDLLDKLGLARRIAFATPSFLAAPHVAAATDLLLIAPARVATAFQKTLPLVTFKPPFELPGFRVAMFWHDRHDADPAHQLLRRELQHVAATLTKRR